MHAGELSPLDVLEQASMIPAELEVDYRLACRARVLGPASVTLEPSLGAALFLDDREFERGEHIAAMAEHIDLDLDSDFN
jgi:hypothetical protein